MFSGIFMQAAPAGAGSNAAIMQIVFLAAIFLIFYVILILPESKRRKALKKQISEMKPGTRVMTSGGIIGTVDFINEKTVYVKSIDSKFETSKESVVAILDQTAPEKK